MDKNESIVGFCTTCRNRLWQIRETLPLNLRVIENTPHTISLVDFGSSDGLSSWIWSNFRKEIEFGKLTYFEVTNNVKWNISKAKNLAHRISQCGYLFSLDADNFITAADIERVENIAIRGLLCHQFSGNYSDGTHGRIGLPKVLFEYFGGYDESFLPMGYQDQDLLDRLLLSNTELVQLGAPNRMPIQNTIQIKMREFNGQLNFREGKSYPIHLFKIKMAKIKTRLTGIRHDLSPERNLYTQMNQLNQMISKFKIANEGPIRLNNYSSYSGILNGQEVIIDGLNRPHLNL